MASRTEQSFGAGAWVTLALDTPAWTPEKRARAQALRAAASHLGEVAEALNCSVLEVQAELGIGPPRTVRAYRTLRSRARGSEPVQAA